MQVGDLVRHRYGTLRGYGIVISLTDGVDENGRTRRITALWPHIGTGTTHSVAAMYLDVVNKRQQSYEA